MKLLAILTVGVCVMGGCEPAGTTRPATTDAIKGGSLKHYSFEYIGGLHTSDGKTRDVIEVTNTKTGNVMLFIRGMGSGNEVQSGKHTVEE